MTLEGSIITSAGIRFTKKLVACGLFTNSSYLFLNITPSSSSRGCGFVENRLKLSQKIRIAGESPEALAVKIRKDLWKNLHPLKFTGIPQNSSVDNSDKLWRSRDLPCGYPFGKVFGNEKESGEPEIAAFSQDIGEVLRKKMAGLSMRSISRGPCTMAPNR